MEAAAHAAPLQMEWNPPASAEPACAAAGRHVRSRPSQQRPSVSCKRTNDGSACTLGSGLLCLLPVDSAAPPAAFTLKNICARLGIAVLDARGDQNDSVSPPSAPPPPPPQGGRAERRALCAELLAHQGEAFRPRAAKRAHRRAERHSAVRAWHAKCAPARGSLPASRRMQAAGQGVGPREKADPPPPPPFGGVGELPIIPCPSKWSSIHEIEPICHFQCSVSCCLHFISRSQFAAFRESGFSPPQTLTPISRLDTAFFLLHSSSSAMLFAHDPTCRVAFSPGAETGYATPNTSAT